MPFCIKVKTLANAGNYFHMTSNLKIIYLKKWQSL